MLYYNSKDITVSSVSLSADVGEPGVAEIFILVGSSVIFLIDLFYFYARATRPHRAMGFWFW